MGLGQILSKDLNLALYGLNELLHSRGGPLLKDSLYPSSSGYHFFHGAAVQFLDFCRQWPVESAEKSVNLVPLCRFLIAGDAGVWRVSQPLLLAQSFLLSLFSIVSTRPKPHP